MKPICFLFISMAMLGCGPLSTPMARRPNFDDQKEIDDAWNRALSPADKLTRQEWLDLFVGAQAYQVGVDKLHMRSEKQIAKGHVEMEVRYDRDSPEEDLFEVRVFNSNGKILRKERYTREDVESTYDDLFSNVGSSDDEERAKFDKAHNSRWEKIIEYFPHAKQPKKTQG